MNSKTLSIFAWILGAIFVLLAIFYWMTPANALPHYVPGYNPVDASPHFKHGLASFLLGLALFAFAWFKGGKKSAGQ